MSTMYPSQHMPCVSACSSGLVLPDRQCVTLVVGLSGRSIGGAVSDPILPTNHILHGTPPARTICNLRTGQIKSLRRIRLLAGIVISQPRTCILSDQ